MRCFAPLAVYCISLVSLQQLRALPAQERPDGRFLDKLIERREETASATGSQTRVAAAGPSQKWPPSFLRLRASSVARTPSPSPAWTRPAEASHRALRGRRHAHHYSHAQLMRVGCVLGTCQVQNLSHRLYQLIGQSGREDSSPINPRSPHSYG